MCVASICLSLNVFAQVKMGNNLTTIGASSVLEIESTNKGVVFPRMTGAQMNAIATPVSGMSVYNTDSLCICQYNGTAWRSLCGSTVGSPDLDWHVTGNTGTTASTAAIGSAVNNNFIGTTDAKDFVMVANNLERMRIASGGNIGLGVLAPSEALSLNGNILRRIAMERHTIANTAGNTLVLRSGGATSGATDRNGGTLSLVSGVSTGTGSSTIGFETAAGGASGTSDNALTQKMIILGDGKVGMGLTNPFTNLNVRGAVAAAPNSSGSNSNAILRLDAQNNAIDMGVYSAAPFGSWIQSTTVGDLATNQQLALNPNGGYIGIGTATPDNRLEIINNAGLSGTDDNIAIKSYGSTLNPELIFQTAAGSKASPLNLSNGSELGNISWWGQVNGTGTYLSAIRSILSGSGTNPKSNLKFSTSGIERMIMDSIGSTMLAINTTTYAPKTSFHLYGDGTGGYTLQGTTLQPVAASGPDIGFSRGGFSQGVGAAIQFIDYNAYSGGLAFLVHRGTQNNAGGAFADNWPLDVIQAMTIVNNGQIGIGTGDPKTLLQVNGGVTITPPAAINITSDNFALTVGNNSTINITSNSNVANSRTIVLSNGLANGQLLFILFTGSSNVADIPDSGNCRLAGNMPFGVDETLSLMWNGSNWVELRRSVN